jgi:hypothetical protein
LQTKRLFCKFSKQFTKNAMPNALLIVNNYTKERQIMTSKLSVFSDFLTNAVAKAFPSSDAFADTEALHDTSDTHFALTRWPELPSQYRVAAIYGALSVMESRPVSEFWLQRKTKLSTLEFEKFKKFMLANDAFTAHHVDHSASA